MSTLSQRVELFQEIDYSHAGVSPDSINSFIKSKSEDVRGENVQNRKLLEGMKGPSFEQINDMIENTCRVLGLEKPKYSGSLSDLTSLLIFQRYKEFVEDQQISAVRIITTTFSNNFTSFVCGDNEGSYAVVLSDLSLTKIIDMLALVPLAFKKLNGLIVTSRDVFSLYEITQGIIDDEENTKGIAVVGQDFVLFPLFGRSPYHVEPTISIEHMNLTARMVEYVAAFLLLHEIAHVVLRHVGNDALTGLMNEPELLGEIELLHTAAVSMGLFSAASKPSHDAIAGYMRKQLEFQADQFALNTIASKLLREYRDQEILTEEIGYLVFSVSLYFFYSAYMEKAHVYLRTGINPDCSKIIGQQHGIENLYFRSSHPSPISRVNSILGWILTTEFSGASVISVDREKIRAYAAQASTVSSLCWSTAKMAIQKIMSEHDYDATWNKFKGEIGDSALLCNCVWLERMS